jgi:membrane protease YdiL (CAAX protease family)
MNEVSRIPKPPPDRRALTKEISWVFALQLVLIVSLVQLDRVIGLGGNLHMLVAVVFILLPVIVLDRTGRPYERYAISFGKPVRDVAWSLGAMALLYPPIVLFAPAVWGLDSPEWRFAWPKGYPGLALSHFVVVALPEEFFYRGYLMGRLDDILPGRIKLLGARVGPGLLIQAALFAVGHFLVDFNPGRLAVFFPALAFGWLKARRRGLVAPVVFHAGSNVFMEIYRTGLGL